METPPNPLVETIRSIVPLNPADITLIDTLFQPLLLKKNDYFVQSGQVCSFVGFIQFGLVRYFVNQDGDEKIYDFGLENDFVCDYESFLPQKPCRRAIQAIEDSSLLVISWANLQRLFSELAYGERFGRVAIEQILSRPSGNSFLFTQILPSNVISHFWTPTRAFRRGLPNTTFLLTWALSRNRSAGSGHGGQERIMVAFLHLSECTTCSLFDRLRSENKPAGHFRSE